MPPESPSAALFDMDGTLLDSEPLWLIAETATMKVMGCGWETNDQMQCLGGPVDRVVDYMQSKLSDSAAKEFSTDWIQAHLMAQVLDRYQGGQIPWMPGARELVASGRELDLPLALVTNSPRAVVTGAHLGIIADLGYDPFGVVIVGDEVNDPKPHPEPFVTAAACLGAAPGACLAIEDSPTGLRAAIAAGCGVIAIAHLAELSEFAGVGCVKSLAGHTYESLWQIAGDNRPR